MSTTDPTPPARPGSSSQPGPAVAIVTIANPAVRNALDDRARRQLLQDVTAAAASPATVIVLRGDAGTFCSGADLRSIRTDDASYLRTRLTEMQTIVRTLRGAPQVVVAAVDGFAIGSGLALAAASDLVVAAEDATFGATFGRVGLTGDSGIFWTLPERIGAAATRRLLLLAEAIDGAEALRLGLVDALTQAEDVQTTALAWADRLAQLSPAGLQATKRLVTLRPSTFEESLRAELHEQEVLMVGPGFAEGRSAFLERRTPTFPPADRHPPGVA